MFDQNEGQYVCTFVLCTPDQKVNSIFKRKLYTFPVTKILIFYLTGFFLSIFLRIYFNFTFSKRVKERKRLKKRKPFVLDALYHINIFNVFP